MLRRLAASAPCWAAAFFITLPACSVLVDLDSDGVRPYEAQTGGMGGGINGPSSGGNDSSGGADPSGGSPSTGGSSTGGDDGTGGTGFVPVDLPLAYHYWALDETSGGTVTDQGYQPLNGTAVQDSDWSSGSGVNGGNAFEVKRSGAANYVQLVNSVLPKSETFSLSWWVSPTELDTGNVPVRFLVSKQGANSQGGFHVIQTASGMQLLTGGEGAERKFEIDVELPDDGEWSHLVLTYRLNASGVRDRLSFYLNGERVLFESEADISSGDANPYNETQIVRFGAVEGNRYPMYSGLLDEIRLYELELSQDEVQTLYRFDSGEIEEPNYYDPRDL